MKKMCIMLLAINYSLSAMTYIKDIGNNLSKTNRAFLVIAVAAWLTERCFQDKKNNDIIKKAIADSRKNENPLQKMDKAIFSDDSKKNASGESEVDASAIQAAGGVIPSLSVATFLEKFKNNNCTKENAPIAYQAKEMIEASYCNYLLQDVKESKDWYKYLFVLLAHPLMPSIFYYCIAKYIINTNKLNINPLKWLFSIEGFIVLSKFLIWKKYLSEDKSVSSSVKKEARDKWYYTVGQKWASGSLLVSIIAGFMLKKAKA